MEIQSQEDLLHYAKELQKLGAKNVLVSMGGEGSILLTQTGQVYSANVPEGKVLNSVGAGDSMLAGFISQYTRCLLYTSPSPRDRTRSRMPSSA